MRIDNENLQGTITESSLKSSFCNAKTNLQERALALTACNRLRQQH